MKIKIKINYAFIAVSFIFFQTQSFRAESEVVFPKKRADHIEISKKALINSRIGQSDNNERNLNKKILRIDAESLEHTAVIGISEILEGELDGVSANDFAKKTLRNYVIQYAAQLGDLKDTRRSIETRSSILHRSFFKKYLTEVYNDPQYAQILSQNATYILEFLDISNEFALSCEDIYIVLRLFNHKLKQAGLIDDTVAHQLFPRFPGMVKHHFKKKKRKEAAFVATKKNIASLLLTKFTSEPEMLQNESASFIDDLSFSLASLVELAKAPEKSPEDETKEQQQNKLRSMIVIFFNTILDKLYWNCNFPQTILTSFETLSNEIIRLGSKGIIDDADDLDSLLWSLTLRFCYFIDAFGKYLPASFFEDLEKKVLDEEIKFLEFDEQDMGIKSKKEILLEYIKTGREKAVHNTNS